MTLLILCLALMLLPGQRGGEVQVNLVPAPPPRDRPFDASRACGS